MRQLSYGVREFQAHVGDVLRAVDRGDRVLVTSRGRPVAIVTKPPALRRRHSAVEHRLQRLAADGKIVLPTAARNTSWRPPSLGGGLARQLAEDRNRLETGSRGSGGRRSTRPRR